VENLKILFDVDNVLADSMNCWCEKASKQLGYTVSKKDIVSHKIVGSVPMASYEIFKLQDEVWNEWRQLPPTEDEIPEKLQSLRKKDFKVLIATSRPIRSVACVKNWIHMMGIIHDGFFALGPFKPKAEINSEILVDDAPEQIEKFIARGRKGFLYQQPWNISAKIPQAIVIKRISDLLDHL
jgi:5'(3')-deoxyribonucleotidase